MASHGEVSLRVALYVGPPNRVANMATKALPIYIFIHWRKAAPLEKCIPVSTDGNVLCTLPVDVTPERSEKQDGMPVNL
jgi:hypothetical protein